ncbi:MAG: DUF167 domain-containing protein [Thermoplasmatota archaeon]
MNEKKYVDSIQKAEKGIYLDVMVLPNSSSNGINSYNEWRNTIEISLTEKPICGKSNMALKALISKEFKLDKKDIIIVKGHKSRNKRLFLKNITYDKVIKKLSCIVE